MYDDMDDSERLNDHEYTGNWDESQFELDDDDDEEDLEDDDDDFDLIEFDEEDDD